MIQAAGPQEKAEGRKGDQRKKGSYKERTKASFGWGKSGRRKRTDPRTERTAKGEETELSWPNYAQKAGRSEGKGQKSVGSGEASEGGVGKKKRTGLPMVGGNDRPAADYKGQGLHPRKSWVWGSIYESCSFQREKKRAYQARRPPG